MTIRGRLSLRRRSRAIRRVWPAALLAVLATVGVVPAAAGPTDPPYPARINFPPPSVDPATGAVTVNYSPEGIAVSGNTFYAGSTQTGEVIKGNLMTGAYQSSFGGNAWVAPTPAQPSNQHRNILGLLVDSQNRLWAVGTYGMACGGNNQPACPAGLPTPITNYGAVFVFDATSGAQLAQYTLTNAATKGINDIIITGNAAYISNTNGDQVVFRIPLGPGGALPPGDVPPDRPAVGAANPAVTTIPTPGFTGADGIDVLPNGSLIINSVTGTSNGDMIVVNPNTGTVTPVTVTAEPGRVAKALLSGDGVALDGNMLYYPENRTDVATCPAPDTNLLCPGDIAAVRLN